MPFSLIPFALLVVPLLEIAVFVLVGGQIGVFPTLGLVVVTAIGGAILLRIQGFDLMTRIRGDMEAGRVPARELVHGVMILIAGVLLLTPGFVTDTCGFLLFVPPIRDAAWAFFRSRVTVVGVGGADFRRPSPHDRAGGSGQTIDLNADDYASAPDPDTPWGEDDPDRRR